MQFISVRNYRKMLSIAIYFRMSEKKVDFNFILEDEVIGFYSKNLAFSPIVNCCFEVNAVFVARSFRGVELRFFLPFIRRLFGYSTAETIDIISKAIHREQGREVEVVTSKSTNWFCVSTQQGESSFSKMKTACEALADLYRKKQPDSPTVVNHTRSVYNLITIQPDAKEDPADEPVIEAMRLLRLAELRRVLVFPQRLSLEEESQLYQPFELSEKKRMWVSHLKFFGYYEKESQAPDDADAESHEVATSTT